VFVAELHAAGVPDEVSNEMLTGGIRKQFLEKLADPRGLGLSKETATAIYKKFFVEAAVAEMSTASGKAAKASKKAKALHETKAFLVQKCGLDRSTVDRVLLVVANTRIWLKAKRDSLGKSRSRSRK